MMKKNLKNIAVAASFAFILIGGAIFTSCEESCEWYVDDEDDILTGYIDEDTCKEWASEWSDVTCDCI